MSSKKFLFFFGIIAIGIAICFYFFSMKNNTGRRFSVDAKASLEKVLEINELQSVEYVYNSYVIYGKYKTEYEKWFLDALKKSNVTEANFNQLKQDFNGFMKEIEEMAKKDVSENELDEEFKEFMKKWYPNLIEFYEDDFAEEYFGGLVAVLVYFSDYKNDIFDDYYLLGLFPPDSYSGYEEMLTYLFRNNTSSNDGYAVSYRGNVRLGINEPVTFTINDDESEIIVNIPKIKILDCTVVPDEKTMHFIYFDNKYKKSGIIKEVLTLCNSDLSSKIKSNTELFKLAEQNIITTLEALCLPFKNNMSYNFKYATGGAD